MNAEQAFLALQDWLDHHAVELDSGNALADELLPVLARSQLIGASVPITAGGLGGDIRDAVRAIASVAEHSLTAAFVLWGQRTFIEYLLQSPNSALRERELPTLLTGKQAGATGLSNAMKYLCGIESLQVEAQPSRDGWILNGKLPWVTNLRTPGFLAAAAVAAPKGTPPFIAALRSHTQGITRSPDLDLLGLRGSNTAALNVDALELDAAHIIHTDARQFLPQVRPAFLGMQCGLSIGLARASLDSANRHAARSTALADQIVDERASLELHASHLLNGLADGRYHHHAAALFRMRIQLANNVQRAVALELQASGGRAYLLPQGAEFARRWHEAAFIPLVTPSVSQLQGELQKHAEVAAA